METICQLCGANISAGESCRERFERCLALEYEHPDAFGAVHHLLVAGYMLQHNAYSREVWLEARRMLERFIQEGVLPTEVRAENRGRYNSKHRTWHVTRGPRLAEFDQITWSFTLLDVRLDDAEIYCADVRRWAVSILEDTAGLMHSLGRRSFQR